MTKNQTSTPTGSDRQMRLASIVMLVTFPLWLAVSWVGGEMGLQPSYAILADLAALAAFTWSLVVLFQVWRKRQQAKD